MPRGRKPRVPGEPATARIWAWLTTSERRALEAVAAAEHCDVAVLIREAVNTYVADYSERKVFVVTGNSLTA